MEGLKIVQVNTVCGSGSVGRIVVDLYHMIEKNGGSCLASYGRGSAPDGILGTCIGNPKDFYCHVLRNFFMGESGFGSEKVTKQFIAWLKEEKPDVIHLHNIHGFYLQVELLFKYLKEAEICVVWTLHDCWPFTGHCAYFDYARCDKWKEGCHSCIQHAKAYPYALFKDNSIQAYERKKEAFCGVKNLTIVTPSRWLADLVKQSFLKEYPVRVIPNGIDLSRFKPGKQRLEGIREDKKIVLGVANIWEKRKGLSYFEELAKKLPEEYQIVLVGVDKKTQKALYKKYDTGRVLTFRRTESVEQLASLYAQADVYVNATLEDNFPTTNLEALACGTPVVTFDTGGSKESLDEQCGRVVTQGNLEELILAVEEVCEGEKPVEACVKRAEEFDKTKRFKEYLDLYQEIRKDCYEKAAKE